METNKNDKLLDIRDLSVEYHSNGRIVKAVSHLNLSVKRGETLGFVGETGAGKTTTALSILRILPEMPSRITGGEIWYNGENLLLKSKNEMRSIRGREISMIFQDPMTSLDPVKTVGTQIEEMIGLHEKLSRHELRKRSVKMLGMVGIKPERIDDYPHEFSGGMQQRVVIAIALSCNPNLLIADEPTTALDVTIQAQVLELMKDLKKQYRMSMIMITHDLGIVAEICDRVAIMYAGNVVESGSVEQVYDGFAHPYTKALFDSVPSLDEDQEELKVISGWAPDPTNLPGGCPFHPRCPYASSECSERPPLPRETEPGHILRCHKDVLGGSPDER